MSKVYVLNKGAAHDFSAAEEYGELIYCTHGRLQKYDVGQMVRECSDAMSESMPDDFILLTSLTTLCSVACSLFAVKHNLLNLLIYKDDKYVVRKIDFNNCN